MKALIAFVLSVTVAAPLPPRPVVCEPVRRMPRAADDLPPLLDLERFPDADVTRDALAWLDRHLEWLRAQADLDLVYPEFWAAWIEDAREARAAWDVLRIIYTPQVVEGDRVRLAQLKVLLGEEAYGVGRMPWPPLWRFKDLP